MIPGPPGSSPAVRALGIDHGDARVGVSASDALGLLAHPLETIDRRQYARPELRVRELVEARGVTEIVVGLPLRMDGTEGRAVDKVRGFAERLRAVLPAGVRIHFVDERLSTVTAQSQLRAAGRKARTQRPVVDQAAAVVILQDWLDQQQGPQALLLPDPWED